MDGGGDIVEVAGPDLLLVRDKSIAALRGRELRLLHPVDIVAHAFAARVAVRQVEHVEPHAVNACQGDELIDIAERRQLLLKRRDGFVVQVFLPVERRRAVIRQQPARASILHALRELAREAQVRGAGLAPHQVGVRRVRRAARHRLLQAVLDPEESLRSALAGEEPAVAFVDIRGQQAGGLGVGARQQHGRHIHDIRGQPRRNQFFHRLAGRHQHLAAHVAAFFHRRQLVLEMHARGPGRNHVLRQFEGVEHAAEAGLGVGHDGEEVVDIAGVAFPDAALPLDFIGAGERVVDAPRDRRHRVVCIQRLVRIHGFG